MQIPRSKGVSSWIHRRTGKGGSSCCPLLPSSLLGPFLSQVCSHTISTGDLGPGCLWTAHLTPYLHLHCSLSLEFPHLRHPGEGRKETMQNSVLLLLCFLLSAILAHGVSWILPLVSFQQVLECFESGCSWAPPSMYWPKILGNSVWVPKAAFQTKHCR